MKAKVVAGIMMLVAGLVFSVITYLNYRAASDLNYAGNVYSELGKVALSNADFALSETHYRLAKVYLVISAMFYGLATIFLATSRTKSKSTH